ncbi:MAG: ester cyclase [Candidatus Kariarchaeaceae archaeon]|jgi:predicted ester cyclase
MSEVENKRVAKLFALEYLTNKNINVVYDIFHPDHQLNNSDSTLSWIEPQFSNRERPVDHYQALVEIGKSIKEAFPEFKVIIKQLLAENSVVSMFCNLEGHHLGTWYGYPATGITVNFDVAYFMEFKDGKILTIHYVTDTLSMNYQIGRALVSQNDNTKLQEYLDHLQQMGLLPSG